MLKDLSAKYYQDNQERLLKKSSWKYWSLSKGEKETKPGHESYKNLLEYEKQKLRKNALLQLQETIFIQKICFFLRAGLV